MTEEYARDQKLVTELIATAAALMGWDVGFSKDEDNMVSTILLGPRQEVKDVDDECGNIFEIMKYEDR